MNNDLEQFSEKRLQILADYSCSNATIEWVEIEALARIALAAKQAKPVGVFYPTAFYIKGKYKLFTIDEAKHSGLIRNGILNESYSYMYTTPQPAHTEQVNSPMQPLHIDEFGTIRFKENAIVQHLLDVAKHVGVNMNTIAMQGFKPEDEMQFAQLIGYSLSGYGELSYVTDESYERASAAAPKPESER